MAGAALGILAGLGQGAGGLPTGLALNEQERQRQQALGLQQQTLQQTIAHQQAQEAVDVPVESLPSNMRARVPPGQPTLRVPTPLVPGLQRESAEERADALATQRNVGLAAEFEKLGTPEAQSFARILRAGGAKSPDTLKELTGILGVEQQRKNRELTGRIARGFGIDIPTEETPPSAPPQGAALPPARIQPTGGMDDPEAFKAAAEAATQFKQSRDALLAEPRVQGQGPPPPPGVAATAAAVAPPGAAPPPAAAPPGPRRPPPGTKVHIAKDGTMTFEISGPTESRAVYTREDIDDLINQREKLQTGIGGPAFTPLERREMYNDLARQLQIQPGGQVVGAATGLATWQPKGPGGQPAPAATPGRALAERAASPEQSAHYVHKETLNPPPANWTLTQIQNSGQYVPVNAQALPAVKQLNTVSNMLNKAQDIIDRRPDLFPKKTGNVVLDNLNVAKARGIWLAGKLTDPDVGELGSLQIALPAAIKSFGDTGNVAVAERDIAAHALGLSPTSADQAAAKLSTIRDLVNSSATSGGFPTLIRRRPGTQTPPASGEGGTAAPNQNPPATGQKVQKWIKGPDGRYVPVTE